MPYRAEFEQRMRELTDHGLLIEAGWIGLRIAAIPADMAPDHLVELRNAFFAGAQHLFASIVTILDPATPEPTEADLLRMDQIDAELKEFIKDYAARHLPVKGTA